MHKISEDDIRTQAARDGVTHFSTGVATVKGNKVLVVRRAAHDHLGGVYELPGGGVDGGETFEQSATREMLEETGLKVTKIITIREGFDYQTPSKPKVRQINFIVETTPGQITLNPNEHDHYRLITAKDIAQLSSTENMKQALREIFKHIAKS